jgi:hypothetical protein
MDLLGLLERLYSNVLDHQNVSTKESGCFRQREDPQDCVWDLTAVVMAM